MAVSKQSNIFDRTNQNHMKRIQRKRTKGWRLPKNTVCITRPSKWGNPIKLVGNSIYIDASWRLKQPDHWVCLSEGDIEDVVEYYEFLLYLEYGGDNEDLAYWSKKLKELPFLELDGKDVACFCKEGGLCHGDILIKRVKEKVTRYTTINLNDTNIGCCS